MQCKKKVQKNSGLPMTALRGLDAKIVEFARRWKDTTTFWPLE
jgi:hypothetical protein